MQQTPSNRDENKLRDVWDGLALKPLCAPGRFFSSSANIALSLSTDGVPLYKSSTMSLWPVYLVILNLPAAIRMKAQNIILCGFWVGPTKPIMKLLLEPIASYLNLLSTLGTTIKVAKENVVIRAKLVMGIFDLPAKAAVLCCKQYNGEYGCQVCLHPGKRLSNNSRIYLPPCRYPERTHAQILTAAKLAQQKNKTVLGVNDLSPLASVLDLVVSVPVDYMHCVLEGVTRWLMGAWFNSCHHGSPFYIGRSIDQIDNSLTKLTPPQEVSRPPRSIKKHMKYWKASELRNWLLYYSLPLLLNTLPPLYWHHYALLVCAMHILLSDVITHAQVDAAQQMLTDFCHLLPELYGHSSCTANAHLLCHLSKYVRLWGPLWTHSAFGFESKNGHLKHLFHGKSDILHQLIFNINVHSTLQSVHSELLIHESDKTISYINHLVHMTPRSTMTTISDHIYMVGQCKVAMTTADQAEALSFNGVVEVFFRLMKDSILYYSTSYVRGMEGKRDNTYCYFKFNDSYSFGQIHIFVLTPLPCALIKKLECTDQTIMNQAGHPCRPSLIEYKEANLLHRYIVPVKPLTTTELCAVPLHNIISKVVIIKVTDKQFCIMQPNTIEYH